MERIVLHCDLNNFFASVECALNPEITKGKPVAVCGRQDQRHGVVLAKNEQAKAFGVKTGEAVWQALRKCPALVLLPPHMKLYQEYSRKVQGVYEDYTDQVEPFGIDECWLDVTGSVHLFGSGEDIANSLRQRVKDEFNLTISVGVSYNKILAKLGSDLKKPDAVTTITPKDLAGKVWPLPIGALMGVGRASERNLNNIGLNTIGDVAKCEPKTLQMLLGKNGLALWRYANGQDNSPVARTGEFCAAKSIGNSVTLVRNLKDDQQVWKVLLALAEQVTARMRADGVKACGFALSVKDCTLAYKEYMSRFEQPTNSVKDLAEAAMAQFKRRYRWQQDVRALGLRCVDLISAEEAEQLSLFDMAATADRTQKLEKQVDLLRGKFGTGILRRATLMLPSDIGGE